MPKHSSTKMFCQLPPKPQSISDRHLDEANRLDKENLGVLFDLCQNLELQLVVAAPEVARAEGNTTYRLVRRVGSDGHEEVIVTGRRAVGGLLPNVVTRRKSCRVAGTLPLWRTSPKA